MGKTLRRTPNSKGVKVRSMGMVAMNQRGGDGTHGGGKRTRNRRDRQAVRQSLRGSWA